MPEAADLNGWIKAELGAVPVGPSMWGAVYRYDDGSGYVRLIPNNLARVGARLRETDRWDQDPTGDRLAPVVSTEQRQLGSRWFRVVDYRIAARHTLSEVILGPDPIARVAAVIAVIRALPEWWERCGRGFLPLPVDIVFAGEKPYLLRTPCWGVPEVRELFGAPERILHLAPEVVRGAVPAQLDERADVYSVAAMVLRCFVRPGTLEPRMLMHRAASGVALRPEDGLSRLPLWMDRQVPVREAVEAAIRLAESTDPAAGGLPDLVTALSAGVSAMEPLASVEALRNAGHPGQAMEFARVVLPETPSYQLFLLAADISWRDLQDPLEGLSLLDKAVALDDGQVAAYLAQFRIISALRDQIMVLLESATDPSFADRLDRTIEHAYTRLPRSERAARDHDMATYLIERDRLPEAARFLYRALHDGDTELWWRFDLMLDYAETFLRLGDLETAAAVAEQTRLGLQRVRQNRTVPMAEVHRHGERLTAFILRLHELRGGGAAT